MHYTDMAGFTDHAVALMHMLGFRFAPRIRDLGNTKLYIPGAIADYPALKAVIGGTLNIKHLRAHWTTSGTRAGRSMRENFGCCGTQKACDLSAGKLSVLFFPNSVSVFI
jgi:TnpA family transposase